jgi:TonB family protein
VKKILLTLLFTVNACTTADTLSESENPQDRVRAAMSDIQECYDDAQKKIAGLRGRVVVEFDYNDRGKVTKCVIKESTLGKAKVESCLCKEITEIKFTPAPTGKLKSSDYAFEFAPPEE